MKVNPALLKLDLFCKGLRIECTLDKDTRPIIRTRGGLGSGLEIILPEDIYCNAPIYEDFAKDSPYTLRKNKTYYLEKDNQFLCNIDIPKKPGFYSKKTSSGKEMSRIGTIQGNYLAIYYGKLCEFWKTKENCKFCSLGLNLGNNEEIEKTDQDIIETIKEASKEVSFIHFNTGHNKIDSLIDLIKKIHTDIPIGVQAPPQKDLKKYNILKDAGVVHLSFCFEIFNKEKFSIICPGKHKHITQETYFKTIKYCTKLFQPKLVTGEIIAGLEPVSDTIAAIDYLNSINASTTVCVFRPIPGTNLEKMKPPKLEDLLPIFKHLANNFPMPNLKVSIVLTPNEATYLKDV